MVLEVVHHGGGGKKSMILECSKWSHLIQNDEKYLWYQLRLSELLPEARQKKNLTTEAIGEIGYL